MLDGEEDDQVITLLSPFTPEYHKLSIPVEDSQSQDGALGQIYYRGKYRHNLYCISVHFFPEFIAMLQL